MQKNRAKLVLIQLLQHLMWMDPHCIGLSVYQQKDICKQCPWKQKIGFVAILKTYQLLEAYLDFIDAILT